MCPLGRAQRNRQHACLRGCVAGALHAGMAACELDFRPAVLMGAHPALEAHHPGGRLLQLFAQPGGVKHLRGAAAVAGEQAGMVCCVAMPVVVVVRAGVGANVRRRGVKSRCGCRLPVGLQQGQGQLPVLALQAGHRSDGLVQPGGARLNLVNAAQIGFVEHQQIGGAQLAQQAVVQQGVGGVRAHSGGVHHHQYAMQAKAFVGQRDLGDGPGV